VPLLLNPFSVSRILFKPSDSGRPELAGAEIWNGKEMDEAHLEVHINANKLDIIWDVGDVKALAGQETRAETEKAIHGQSMDAVEKIIPASVESAVKGAVEAFIPFP
jgi:hypothetical protein